MKGQILDYAVQTSSGVITAEDGSRFTFAGSEWHGTGLPVRGSWVDFEPHDGQATAIYTALSRGSASTASQFVQSAVGGEGKSKPAATLWGIFLGGFGAHKFYMGSWGWGIVYLATCWLYVPFIVALVEWVHYVLMTESEFQAKAAAFEGRGPFGFFW